MNRSGWRMFRCENCGRIWCSATRDRFSMSREGCECGELIQPHDTVVGYPLEVDKFGNLTKVYPDFVLQDDGPIREESSQG